MIRVEGVRCQETAPDAHILMRLETAVAGALPDRSLIENLIGADA